ncbi:ABC transporter substrate-binding protein [Microbacterium sp. AK031]|uniref:ABC transporter substrate-binding protein n=1 Tax=Microbacterium sp. AK031 TaxID=2723076 RepID=UPI00216A0F79|nr:extracellular solute-binding protein [Microbacterium sp. AK031]MCS3844489.1 multiple sugar transport system substrate-binding protein [Microbacterium sp. AK031]
MNSSKHDAFGVVAARSRAIELSRRGFLGAVGVGGMTLLLAACTGGGQSAQQSSTNDGTLQWWDQFRPLTTMLEASLFAPYMKSNAGIEIERRQMEAPDLAQAIQVARRSNQMPDVHSLAGLGAASAALVSEDWFQPIGAHADFEGSEIGDQLFDGIHRFDGEVYSVPLFSGRFHEATPWVNTELLGQADVDPAQSPATWDDMRATARQITDKTGVHGLVIPTKEVPYLTALITYLAQSAGAPGTIDWKTGDYAFNSQGFVDAIEFLLSLQKDGVVHPSSPSMGARDARARWAAGEAGIYMWGPWIIGGLMVDEPHAVERGVDAWRVPTAEPTRPMLNRGPGAGVFWVNKDSHQAKPAAELLLQMSSRDFQLQLAAAMDQPPALDVVAEADVHPAYARNIGYMADDVRISPVPEAGNPSTWRVAAEMQDIHPNLGEVVQAILTGSTGDIKGELTKLNDAMSAERDRAIESVKKDGAEVSIEDWVFSNWDPATDYDQAAYAAR